MSPAPKNFRLNHCTGSSLSQNSPIYCSGKGLLIIPFPSEQLSRITPSQTSSLKVVHKIIPVSDPLSLVRMWLNMWLDTNKPT